ncbi:TPA: RHS domain-containing protein [Serratia rubidaea]|nr:RHS domain-containing protein [Serratia rubidaea]HDJ1460997.1 RHS domain-containing protein [Serratia rubidaea]
MFYLTKSLLLNLVEHLFGSTDSWSYEPDSPWTPLAAIEQAGESRQADIFWLHSEQNGAPLEVMDGEGGLRWSGDYDTFGRLQGPTATGIMQRRGVAYEQPLRYAGQRTLICCVASGRLNKPCRYHRSKPPSMKAVCKPV